MPLSPPNQYIQKKHPQKALSTAHLTTLITFGNIINDEKLWNKWRFYYDYFKKITIDRIFDRWQLC